MLRSMNPNILSPSVRNSATEYGSTKVVLTLPYSHNLSALSSILASNSYHLLGLSNVYSPKKHIHEKPEFLVIVSTRRSHSSIRKK
jgi:hypothetical protein